MVGGVVRGRGVLMCASSPSSWVHHLVIIIINLANIIIIIIIIIFKWQAFNSFSYCMPPHAPGFNIPRDRRTQRRGGHDLYDHVITRKVAMTGMIISLLGRWPCHDSSPVGHTGGPRVVTRP